MPRADFESDCERCAALCCVVLSFERSELFGCDKPALSPCPELSGHRCRIHARLRARGFAGCASYECYGAGPRVVHELFGGRSWRDDASLLGAMATAFAVMREIQELRLLLETASRLPLAADERARLAELRAALEPTASWSEAALSAFEQSAWPREIHAFLRGLRRHFRHSRRLPVLEQEAPGVSTARLVAGGSTTEPRPGP